MVEMVKTVAASDTREQLMLVKTVESSVIEKTIGAVYQLAGSRNLCG
jgi:hypothetical protein